MFQLKNNAQLILYTQPINLHKGFDRLTVIVQTELGLDLTNEIYVLFCNRKRNRVKVLYRDGDNLAIWCKRLNGTLVFKNDEKTIFFDQIGFANLLNNIRLRRPSKRYKVT